jgi:large subunit ribosomal protein L24
MNIRKGDRVIVRSGKYRGHKSDVVLALPAENKVIVDGVNMAKRHSKPTRKTTQGGIIDKYMPMPVSAVSLLCRSCGEATRIGHKFDDNGNKVRVCKKCGSEV